MSADLPASASQQEGYIPAANAELYYRAVGYGPSIVVLHGGPDFDHRYLLPDMDRLADAFRLIYYDQRGRGRSAGKCRPEDISIESECEDLERVRQHFGLPSLVILGHSWGALLALEYALRHPGNVSRLILMNAGPASYADLLLFRQHRQAQLTAADVDTLQALAASAEFLAGDPDAVAAYYRIYFSPALRQAEHLNQVIDRLRATFTTEGILKARIVEERLVHDTWLADGYDLLPRLERLNIPTLVIHGDADFVPVACAMHIAQALPRARLMLLQDCGHFAYLERPDAIRQAIGDFV